MNENSGRDDSENVSQRREREKKGTRRMFRVVSRASRYTSRYSSKRSVLYKRRAICF